MGRLSLWTHSEVRLPPCPGHGLVLRLCAPEGKGSVPETIGLHKDPQGRDIEGLGTGPNSHRHQMGLGEPSPAQLGALTTMAGRLVKQPRREP